jgi:pyridoxine 5-phosphate synthase
VTRLSVNVDHVATVRQARRAAYPDPLEAALLAERAGAAGITVHLRADRRHIQDHDVRSLRRRIRGKLNLEMAASQEMVAVARAIEPDQVTLVPERPEEVTTEGGLDLTGQIERVVEAGQQIVEQGASLSLFLDPDPRQIERLSARFQGLARGFEINTDRYSRAHGSGVEQELDKIVRVAERGAAAGFSVYAGHGLTVANVGPISGIPAVEELNIGHALVARSILIGMEDAVREMLAAMAAG